MIKYIANDIHNLSFQLPLSRSVFADTTRFHINIERQKTITNDSFKFISVFRNANVFADFAKDPSRKSP